jgi:hypothetical protein
MLLCSEAFAASTVNPNVPATNGQLASGPVRNNFAAAYSDINNLLGNYAGTTPPINPINTQTWVNTSTSPVYVFEYYNSFNNIWVPYASLNISTNLYTPVFTTGGFAATPPLAVTVPGGVATYSIGLDSNFANNISNQLSFATIANGHLLANCSGSSPAEPGNCTWNSFATQAIGSTNGIIPSYVSGSWGTVTTGTSAHAIPFLDGSNTFSALQTIYPGTAGLRTPLTGTILKVVSLDTTITRIEGNAYGAAVHFSGARSDGTAASPTGLVNLDEIVGFNAFGNDTTSSWVGPYAGWRCYATQTWSSTAHGTRCDVATTPNTASAALSSVIGFENDGGITVPSTVTGGDQGAGTLNLAGGLYNAGTAPTGTGGYVRATSPTLTTPALGAATGASLALGGASLSGNALAVTGTGQFNSAVTLGGAGNVGQLALGNATSGTISLEPPTGALGSVVLTLPDVTDTLAALAATQTLTNKTITSPAISSPAMSGTATGNFTFSGNVTDSGQDINTGTSAPASAAGQTVIMGTITAPTLSNNGQGFLYNTTVNGAVHQGQGSTYDASLADNAGAIALGVSTGTQNIVALGGITAGSIATSGTIGGSICRTAGGLFIFANGVNCFTAGAATSIAPNTTTLSPSVPGSVLWDSSGTLKEAILYNFLGGLTLSNDSTLPNSVLDIAAGNAMDSTNATMISIGAFTKSTAGAWASGSGSNGMGNGLTIAASTPYSVCLAYNGGTPDIWFDTSSACANKPAGISGALFRRIGMFLTNGSSQISAYTQAGDEFYLAANTVPVSSSTCSTTAASVNLGVIGIVTARLHAFVSVVTAADGVLFTALVENDVLPFSLAGTDNASLAGTVGQYAAGDFKILTSAAGQIRVRCSTNTSTYSIYLNGWTDTRGK